MIYLASPYTHKDVEVRNKRAEQAAKFTAYLMEKGVQVYSPIVHGHAVQKYLPEKTACNHKFWLEQCLPFLWNCKEILVLPLEGWEESKGIDWELETAAVLGTPFNVVSVEIMNSVLKRD